MIKKIMALVAALFIAAVAFAGPASATQGGNYEGKKQTLCHSDGQSGKYSKITVDVDAIVNHNGHAFHENDIIAPFDYYQLVDHEWVQKHFNGLNTDKLDLLAFDKCEAPKVPTKVTVTVNIHDECATKNDSVTAVANPAAGANVNVTKTGDVTYVVSADLTSDDYTFDLTGWNVSQDGTHATKTVTLTAEDCGLPETGSKAQYAVTSGVVALVGIAAIGGFALYRRRSA